MNTQLVEYLLELKNSGQLKEYYQHYNVDKNELGIPYEFLCPISGELMIDPVTTHCGITYERVNIQRWFDEGEITDFKTNELLLNQELLEDYNLRQKIFLMSPDKQWQASPEQHTPAGIDRIPICMEESDNCNVIFRNYY